MLLKLTNHGELENKHLNRLGELRSIEKSSKTLAVK